MDWGEKASKAIRNMKIHSEPPKISPSMQREIQRFWDDRHHYRKYYGCRTPFPWYVTELWTEEWRYWGLNLLCDICRVCPAGCRSLWKNGRKLCSDCHWWYMGKLEGTEFSRVPPNVLHYIKRCDNCKRRHRSWYLKDGLCSTCHFEAHAPLCCKCQSKSYPHQYLEFDEKRHPICKICVCSIINEKI